MADQLYQMIISYNCAGQFAQNIFHWRFDDAGFTNTHAAAFDLIGTWSNAHIDHLTNIFAQNCEAVSIKGRRVSGGGGFEAIINYAPPEAGDWLADAQVSGLATVLIGYPLDESRPRWRAFIPGVPEDALVDGKFTNAFQVGVLTMFANGTFASFNLTGGGAPVAVHVIPGTTPANSKLISEYRLSPTPGTMRRRQRPV